MKNKILFLLFFFPIFTSCNDGNINTNSDSSGQLVIGTFNIQWLGDGIDDFVPRTETDYKNIANVVLNSGMDIVALQEIENSTAMERIIKYLPNYHYKITKDNGSQNLAILYNTSISIEKIQECNELKIDNSKTRSGMVAYCKKDNFDWIMLVVHLKSTSRYDNTPEKKEESYRLRKEQANEIVLWSENILNNGTEKDLFIIGDFNDNPERENSNITKIAESKDLVFISAQLTSCKFSYWDGIDQIVVSNSANKRYLSSSIHTYNLFKIYDDNEVKKISDHCPVLSVFDTELSDND